MALLSSTQRLLYLRETIAPRVVVENISHHSGDLPIADRCRDARTSVPGNRHVMTFSRHGTSDVP